MKNPLEQAIKSGVRSNNKIDTFFARIGTTAHPHGYVTTAYRNAARAMKTALAEENRLAAVSDVMQGLRLTLAASTRAIFQEAQEYGADEAARQLRFYGIDSNPERVITLIAERQQAAVSAVLSVVDGQAAVIRAMIMTGAEDELILGGSSRAGELRFGNYAQVAASWAATLTWDSFGWWAEKNKQDKNFQKQAIATLDNRVTDCCLRVHGQVQDFETPFHLTGVPRYSDYKEWPDFHWYCRTSGILYLKEFDDGLTERMRAGADFFMAERKSGRNPDNYPANAFLE